MQLPSPAASRFEVKVDGQTPESWSEVRSHFSDANIYQTWAYGAARWGVRNLSHLVMHRDGQLLAAAQVRIIRMPLLPMGVAYVRWGPLWQHQDGPPDPVIVENMLECLRDEYCKRRGLVLQVIPHAYLESELGAGIQAAAASCDFHADAAATPYRTVLVDLAPSAAVIRKGLDRKWRNHLNRSERNGLALEVTCGSQGYGEFERLYRMMWNRKRFVTTVDVGEFGRIQQQLPADQKMRIFIARMNGEAVAAVVCSLLGDTAIYLLGATNERARELKASYFLQWQVIVWLQEQEARWYDLGGIDPVENPGGYEFKSGFGGNEVTQIPAFQASSGMLGDTLNRGISWLRRRRASAR